MSRGGNRCRSYNHSTVFVSRAEWAEKQKNLPYSERNLIDASGKNFKDKPFLEDWIIRENLKVAASTYAAVGSTPDLDDMIAKVQKKIKIAIYFGYRI